MEEKVTLTWAILRWLLVSFLLLLPSGSVLLLQSGGFLTIRSVIVFCIGRLIAVVQEGEELNKDLTCTELKYVFVNSSRLTATGYFVTAVYWFNCEVSVAGTCISFPAIFHLVNRGISHGPRSLFSDKDCYYQGRSDNSRNTQATRSGHKLFSSGHNWFGLRRKGSDDSGGLLPTSNSSPTSKTREGNVDKDAVNPEVQFSRRTDLYVELSDKSGSSGTQLDHLGLHGQSV